MLSPLLIINSFASWCTYGRYIQHYMLNFPLLYSIVSWWKLSKFMLKWLGTFFSSLIFIVEGKQPTFYFSSSCFPLRLNLHIQTRKFTNIYVSICCLYNPYIEVSKGGTSIQNLMLALVKKTNLHGKIIYK